MRPAQEQERAGPHRVRAQPSRRGCLGHRGLHDAGVRHGVRDGEEHGQPEDPGVPEAGEELLARDDPECLNAIIAPVL